MAGSLSSFAYGYAAANRLTSYTGPDGSLTYGHDNTNQLTGVSGSASESFTYDANGNRNLAGYATGSGNRMTADGTYTYDNEGNRLTKTRVSGGQVADNLGSVRQVMQTGGTIVSSANYAAFGQVRSSAGTGGDRFGFTGREFSLVSGDWYYRARYFDPASGRFLSNKIYAPLGIKFYHEFTYTSPGSFSHDPPAGADLSDGLTVDKKLDANGKNVLSPALTPELDKLLRAPPGLPHHDRGDSLKHL